MVLRVLEKKMLTSCFLLARTSCVLVFHISCDRRIRLLSLDSAQMFEFTNEIIPSLYARDVRICNESVIICGILALLSYMFRSLISCTC